MLNAECDDILFEWQHFREQLDDLLDFGVAPHSRSRSPIGSPLETREINRQTGRRTDRRTDERARPNWDLPIGAARSGPLEQSVYAPPGRCQATASTSSGVDVEWGAGIEYFVCRPLFRVARLSCARIKFKKGAPAGPGHRRPTV